MNEQSRRLVVLRHAKAEPFAASDHDRALTAHGREDAAAAGRWAVAAGVLPDLVVVSSAVRTQETWTGFAAAYEHRPEGLVDASLYGAGTDAALEIVRGLPDEARTAMLVGHNPTMAYLVHLLDDGGADPALFAQVSAGYPTCALTVLEVPGAWDQVDVGTARIQRFHVGRG